MTKVLRCHQKSPTPKGVGDFCRLNTKNLSLRGPLGPWQSLGTIHRTAVQEQASYREIATSGYRPPRNDTVIGTYFVFSVIPRERSDRGNLLVASIDLLGRNKHRTGRWPCRRDIEKEWWENRGILPVNGYGWQQVYGEYF